MSTSKKAQAPADKVEQYERLVATMPEVERKGAGFPYTSANGNMSSCLHPSGILSLRLPPGAREEFLARYDTTLFEAYGIVQMEYVTVPGSLLANTEELAPYFKTSYEYTKTLKPKPSKKKEG
jgi:hypothetical protein